MGHLRVFLDANVLFSAAIGGPAFELLWALEERGTITFVTSAHCIAEADRNLARKRPEARATFERRRDRVALIPEARALDVPHELVEKDRPVYAAAVATQADVLLTGDVRHFGFLMHRDDLPLRVRTVRAFLLEEST